MFNNKKNHWLMTYTAIAWTASPGEKIQQQQRPTYDNFSMFIISTCTVHTCKIAFTQFRLHKTICYRKKP